MDRPSGNREDFDAKTEFMRMEAEEIANRHGIDVERVIAIYKRSPDTRLPVVFGPFQSNLDRAIAILGKHKALQLFESEDIGQP